MPSKRFVCARRGGQTKRKEEISNSETTLEPITSTLKTTSNPK